MLHEMWRVLAPDGLFFARLASNIGLEDAIGRRVASRPFPTAPNGSSSTRGC
jgi:hypothetical protein